MAKRKINADVKKVVEEEIQPVAEPEVQPEPETVVDPEVQPEVKPEPEEIQPESKPEPVAVQAETPLGYIEVSELLKNGNISLVKKLKIISEKSISEIKTVASKLLDFENDLGKNAINRSGSYNISKCYDLMLTLVSVVNTVDRNKFKVKQDIVTLAFIAFKDSSMDPLKLLAFDYLWKYGDKQLTTYQNLTTVMSMLSDKSVREVNKKKVDINNIIKGTILSEQAKTNLVSYYEL